MLTLPRSVRIYLAAGPVDLRKSIDGLGAIAREQSHDVFSGHLFVFTSRRGDRVKILAWDHGGFVLYYKRLERGRFRLPAIAPGATEVELSSTQLAMLLDGIDVQRVRVPKRWEPPRRENLTTRSRGSQ
jgi:transposase